MTNAPTSSGTASDTVRFVLDGERIEVRDVDPTRTVLQFLREDLRRTGTKEGCAEGDCGACTVVVAELNREGDGLAVKAINSCIQLLPTLDGKELITVESLANSAGGLHPVQQAMVDCHGSQCGFCTPGFVMSLFALYKTCTNPTRKQVDDALAGNLCRCTGYRPIVSAAEQMYEYGASDDWLRQPCGHQARPEGRIQNLQSVSRDRPLAMPVGGRQFHAPTTSSELAALLAANSDATILAGGTDVGLWVTKQHQLLDCVVYVGRVKELMDIEVGATDIEIGAAVAFCDVLAVLLEEFPELTELFMRFASPPIRNAATLGGNIANGSPIGDSMPALMVLDAGLVLRSAAGSREISLDDFYKAYMVNDLRPGEFIEKIRIPRRDADLQLRSYKISKRFDQDISAVCAAFAIRFDGERVASIKIAYGGMAATVQRANRCENSLVGKIWNDAAIRTGIETLAADFTPIDDMRSTAAYRLRVAQNLMWRLFLETSGKSYESVYEYGRAG